MPGVSFHGTFIATELTWDQQELLPDSSWLLAAAWTPIKKKKKPWPHCRSLSPTPPSLLPS